MNLSNRKKELEKKEAIWKEEKNLIERENKIKQEKKELKNNKKKLTTSKLLILFLFINCTLIELFTGWVTIKSIYLAAVTGVSPDFTPLVTLIGAVVGEVIGYGVYSVKSMKENLKGGIVYDSCLRTEDSENEDESVG